MIHVIGVEWELAFRGEVTRGQIRRDFEAAGIGCVKVKSDVSIPQRNHNDSTWEIVFPPMADCDRTWEIFKTASEILDRHNAYDPNHISNGNSETAGMHVHVSAAALQDNVTAEEFTEASIRHASNSSGYLSGSRWFKDRMCALSVKDIVKRMHSNQPTVDSMLPSSRRNAFYCQPITARAITRVENANTVEEICSAIGQGKYHVINLQQWNGYKTIEFRQGQCTWSMEKTRQWARLLLALVYSTRQGRVVEGSAQTITTPSRGNEIFRRGTRIAIQYDLMRTENGATTREIIAAMGGTEGDVRRRVSELRDRLNDAAIVTHTQQAQGRSYSDGTDWTRYQVLTQYSEGQPDAMVPENRRLPETIFATLTDEQFEYWQDRIHALS